MSPEVAKAGLALLARVDLKGQEVPVFIAVAQALEAIAHQPPASEQTEAPKRFVARGTPK